MCFCYVLHATQKSCRTVGKGLVHQRNQKEGRLKVFCVVWLFSTRAKFDHFDTNGTQTPCGTILSYTDRIGRYIQFITEVAGSCPLLFINWLVTSVFAASGQLPPVL